MTDEYKKILRQVEMNATVSANSNLFTVALQESAGTSSLSNFFVPPLDFPDWMGKDRKEK